MRNNRTNEAISRASGITNQSTTFSPSGCVAGCDFGACATAKHALPFSGLNRASIRGPTRRKGAPHSTASHLRDMPQQSEHRSHVFTPCHGTLIAPARKEQENPPIAAAIRLPCQTVIRGHWAHASRTGMLKTMAKALPSTSRRHVAQHEAPYPTGSKAARVPCRVQLHHG